MMQKNGTGTYTGGKTNETLKEILGQLEDISNLNDSECEKMDQELDRISQQQKIKNITL
ncbi:hypothetical protein [Fibrobacter sp.]|uniref:hypothetical protein n=1 Tax=Fibrobacter sp. TaxID=35828 RepID=UPI0038707A76